VKKKSK